MAEIRWIFSIALGLLITLLLFYAMQALIATGDQFNRSVTVIPMVDATMPEIKSELIVEIEKPVLQEPAPEVPPPPLRETGNPGDIFISGFDQAGPLELPEPEHSFIISDGDMMPLVIVNPDYPARAASRGIEGWCEISLTVTETGGVRDVQVTQCDPANMFDTASVRAAERFRYSPRIRNGEAVEVPNTRYVFRFTLQ